MKTIAVWTLMAVVMIASQPSYAYGDLLFGLVVGKGMKESSAPTVAPPMTTELPCMGSTSAGLSRHHTAEELEKDLQTRDTVCGHSHMGFGVSSVNDLQCQRSGKVDKDCVRHNQAANVRVPN